MNVGFCCEDVIIGVFREVDRVAVPQVAVGSSGRRRMMAKPAQPGRSDSVVPQASPLATPEVGEEVEKEDYEALAKELENASPLEIMDWALAKFGSDIAIAFRTGIENLARLENRQDPWLVVLYAPWCQAMEGSYVEAAEKLAESGVKVGKFRADRDQKAFAEKELQLGSFPTILFFPKHASIPIKYPSEKRDVHSWLAFVRAL